MNKLLIHVLHFRIRICHTCILISLSLSLFFLPFLIHVYFLIHILIHDNNMINIIIIFISSFTYTAIVERAEKEQRVLSRSFTLSLTFRYSTHRTWYSIDRYVHSDDLQRLIASAPCVKDCRCTPSPLRSFLGWRRRFLKWFYLDFDFASQYLSS